MLRQGDPTDKGVCMSNFSFRKWASRLWEHSTITNKEEEKEEGELVCVICTNGKVASEPVKSEGDNVFIAKAPFESGYYFHPFLDFTGAHSKYRFDIDFFGYRNRFDYSAENKKNEFRILMTGGSKDWGEFMPENLIEEINNE